MRRPRRHHLKTLRTGGRDIGFLRQFVVFENFYVHIVRKYLLISVYINKFLTNYLTRLIMCVYNKLDIKQSILKVL